jgi:hypothetical protein
MKFRTLICGTAIVLASIVITSQVLSQDKGAPPEGGMPDMAEMMKKWLAVASPSEHHKQLEQFVGSWNLTMKMFWAGPGGPPIETKGTSELKWILDGRFLLEQARGEMKWPDATGQMKTVPYEGLGLQGYDNFKNMYVGTWADNLSTHLLTMKAGLDPSGKLFVGYGEMDEPMLDVQDRMVKYVTRIINNDKHVFEIYDLHAGADYKVMEITYERK